LIFSFRFPLAEKSRTVNSAVVNGDYYKVVWNRLVSYAHS
jgi:hypothetical protein